VINYFLYSNNTFNESYIYIMDTFSSSPHSMQLEQTTKDMLNKLFHLPLVINWLSQHFLWQVRPMIPVYKYNPFICLFLEFNNCSSALLVIFLVLKILRSILIEVRTKQKAENALSTEIWVAPSVTVTPNRSLSMRRGDIRCREFWDCEDSEVLNALSNQGITEVKRLLYKWNDYLKKTNTFIPDFG